MLTSLKTALLLVIALRVRKVAEGALKEANARDTPSTSQRPPRCQPPRIVCAACAVLLLEVKELPGNLG